MLKKKNKIISTALAMSMVLSTALANTSLSYAYQKETNTQEVIGKEVYNNDLIELLSGSAIDFEAATKDIVTGHDKNGDIVLAFPAVDTNGEVISGSALMTDSMKLGSSISPFDGTPISGPIISGSKIIAGLYYDENNSPQIDETVISEDYANGYTLEYSTDNENFIQIGTYTRIDHTKAIDGLDGKQKFLVHPMIFTVSGLESDTQYHFRVKAYTGEYKNVNSSEMFNIKSDCYKTFTASAKSLTKTPAFPTAEGGGKYSLGGRGGDVYTVTNLTDDKDNPQPGSLRYGLKRLDLASDGSLSTAPRTIVFNVSGTINLKHWLDITDNTTIAGQTAPGDGIVLSSEETNFGDVKIHGENIIIRYITVRGNEYVDRDSVTVSSAKNVIVDHCTFGWGVDETFTVKEVLNSSFQWNIINEALAMPVGASEAEPKHGMAGIWDGNEVAFHHNIIANSGTRNPRLQGGFRYFYNRFENRVEVSNNVIYNWGHNTGYGGERGYGVVNYENNYLKPGPSTLEKCKSDRIYDVDGTTSKFYANGNILTSSEEITNNNALGLKDANDDQILNEKVQMLIPLKLDDAQTAYERTLDNAGAILPRRSAQDARIINDIKNDTGGMINSPIEVGGYPTEEAVSTIIDNDNDGIADEWEIKNGLNPNDRNDAFVITESGYTNLELYINELAGDYAAIDLTTNPDVTLSVAEQQNFLKDTTVQIPVTVAAQENKTIDKIDLYENNKIVATLDLSDEKVSSKSVKIDYTPSTEGYFNLLARAYDSKGCSTFSTSIPINVNYEQKTAAKWKTIDIGNVGFKGSSSLANDNKTLILKGAGAVAGENDSCYYTYIPMRGDCELITRVDALRRVDTGDGEGKGVKAGIMLRNSLDSNSKMVFGAVTLTKVEDIGKDSFGVLRSTSKEIAAYARDLTTTASYTTKVFGSTPAFGNEEEGNWIRVKKTGKTATVYVSTDCKNWKTLYTTGEIFDNLSYIGLAVDAAQGTQSKQLYNRAEFSNIYLNGESVLGNDGSVDNELIEVFSDDFSSYRVGKMSFGNKPEEKSWYNNFKFYALNAAGEIVTAQSGSMELTSDKYIKITNGPVSEGVEYVFSRVIPTTENGTLNLSFDFKVDNEGNGARIALKDSNGNTAVNVPLDTLSIIKTYADDPWLSVKIQANLTSKTYKLHINDTTIVNDAAFENNSSDISKFELIGTPCDIGINPSFDNIAITAEAPITYPVYYGDVDLNGVITASDAVLTLQHCLSQESVNLNEKQIKAASVIGEEQITAADAAAIMEKALNMDFVFKIEQ